MMKNFGTKKDGIILSVDEGKLTLDYIRQIRNYLNVREKELKQIKKGGKNEIQSSFRN